MMRLGDRAAAAAGTADHRDRQRSCALFIEAFGRPPDFLDGHQHVHLLPQVRDALAQGGGGGGAERLGAAMRPRARRARVCATARR